MPAKDLLALQNVGKATFKDFEMLDISSVEQLTQAKPDKLFNSLEKLTKQAQKPTFMECLRCYHP